MLFKDHIKDYIGLILFLQPARTVILTVILSSFVSLLPQSSASPPAPLLLDVYSPLLSWVVLL